MAVGMAVGVIAVISLLLVGILMITGSSDKSEKIIVPRRGRARVLSHRQTALPSGSAGVF